MVIVLIGGAVFITGCICGWLSLMVAASCDGHSQRWASLHGVAMMRGFVRQKLEGIPAYGSKRFSKRFVQMNVAVAFLTYFWGVVCGQLFVQFFQQYENHWAPMFIAMLLFTCSLIVSLTDLMYTRIPNRVILLFFISLAVMRCFYSPLGWVSYLSAVIFVLLFILPLAFCRSQLIGMGDVKLLLPLSLLLGLPGLLVMLCISSLLAAVPASLFLAARKKGGKETMPYAPFLCLATHVVYFLAADVSMG